MITLREDVLCVLVVVLVSAGGSLQLVQVLLLVPGNTGFIKKKLPKKWSVFIGYLYRLTCRDKPGHTVRRSLTPLRPTRYDPPERVPGSGRIFTFPLYPGTKECENAKTRKRESSLPYVRCKISSFPGRTSAEGAHEVEVPQGPM